MPVEPDDFWQFSVDIYARAGVADACLRLQDRDGLDLNLVLFCLWCGATGRALETQALQAAVAACRPWREQVLLPVRAIRRRLRGGIEHAPGTDAFRAEVKALELQAERMQQDLLRQLAPAAMQAPSVALATQNFDAYARVAARKLAAPADWQVILSAALP